MTDGVELLIESWPRDLGGFSVRRALPSVQRRHVGPFVFFDHMGPLALPAGSGMDVRPHPHIGLATVTFLFEGEIVHRDSLGSVQPIVPGDVNWMVAGRGIVHSERSAPEERRRGPRLHGIQSWVALPLEHEESEPSFEHVPASAIPRVRLEGVGIQVLAGTAFGARAPTRVLSPTLYAAAELEAGARLTLEAEHEERAAYVVQGAVRCGETRVKEGSLAIFRPGEPATLEAELRSHVMLLGGARLDAPRHIWWNFVSSSTDRIERAKDDWEQRRFPEVPGDDERIPLPVSVVSQGTT